MSTTIRANEIIEILGETPEIQWDCTDDFPYVAAAVQQPPCSERKPHWHVHFEFGIVQTGSMILTLPGSKIQLRVGDGYFVNSNVVHTRERTEGVQEALVHTQWFERSLITGVGMIGNRYVLPIEACISMEGVAFRHDMKEHAEILGNISDAYSAARKHESGYELSVCANLNLAWKQLYKMVEGMLSEKGTMNCSGAQRLRVVLAYMHRNYDKAIGIKEINWATGVCERECFRLFDKYFKLTPMEYLSRYRISMAARMLVESDLPINQVSEKCGFQHPGYFSLVFRKMVGKSPREYRNDAKNVG